jgi:hypothetical protein
MGGSFRFLAMFGRAVSTRIGPMEVSSLNRSSTVELAYPRAREA